MWPKFEILTVSGAVFPHVCPSTGELTFGPCQISHLSGQRAKKPIFGPLSKNSTGMAALRARRPVIIVFYWVLSALILSIYLSRDRYLGDGVVSQREILLDGRAASQTCLLPFW